MGLFNFFKTSIVLSAVNKIEGGIKNSNSYNYFAKGDTLMIREYKDFECTLIASAIAVLALDMNLKDSDQKKDIQTVYIGKSSSFLRKIISKKYKCHSIELPDRYDKEYVEKIFFLNIHARFEKYLEDIKRAFEQKSAFYFMEYDEPIVEEWSNEEIYGEKRLFDFIWNLLLAEDKQDWVDLTQLDENWIGYKNFLVLNEVEIQLLDSFVNEIELLLTK